jgi:hypothetical protein
VLHSFFSRHAFVPGTLQVCDPRPILLADTSEIGANMAGDVLLEFPKEDGSPTVILRITGCLYVEHLEYILILVGKLADKGITSIFRQRRWNLRLSRKTLFLTKEFVIAMTRASMSCLLLNNMNTLWFQSPRRMTLEPGTKEWHV